LPFSFKFTAEIWKIIAVKRVSLQHRWCRKPMKYLKHELTMKKTILIMILATVALCAVSCVENYSQGERIGVVTKFSRSGVIWDSWDGHLNVTQTGMNTSGEPFEFSVDNDKNDPKIIATLDSAASQGWKVKIKYHEVWGLKNVWDNRGQTDYFVDEVIVLDKKFTEKLQFNANQQSGQTGHVIDTVYLVIDKSELKNVVGKGK
jgi:hypothetical protein